MTKDNIKLETADWRVILSIIVILFGGLTTFFAVQTNAYRQRMDEFVAETTASINARIEEEQDLLEKRLRVEQERISAIINERVKAQQTVETTKVTRELQDRILVLEAKLEDLSKKYDSVLRELGKAKQDQLN